MEKKGKETNSGRPRKQGFKWTPNNNNTDSNNKIQWDMNKYKSEIKRRFDGFRVNGKRCNQDDSLTIEESKEWLFCIAPFIMRADNSETFFSSGTIINSLESTSGTRTESVAESVSGNSTMHHSSSTHQSGSTHQTGSTHQSGSMHQSGSTFHSASTDNW